MSDLPEPLVPADVDLRDFRFMPLDVLRLRDADLTVLSNGEEFKAAVLLWCVAWHQVPAASLPDDDRLLARHSGTGPAWKKLRGEALRGFVKCSDGRLYHPVIAEKAVEAWESRTEYREASNAKTERQRRWRERCAELSARLRDLGVTPPRGASLETLERLLVDAERDAVETSTVDGAEIGKTGTGTGTGTGILPPTQCAEPLRDSPPPVMTIPIVGNDDGYSVTEADIAEWRVAFPAVNVLQSLRNIRQWNLANAARRKTLRGVRAHIVSWLTREQDRGGTQSLPGPSRRGGTLEHNQAVMERFVAAGGEHGAG